MSEISFDSKAAVYEDKSLIQKLNADSLLTLADTSRLGDILDLGCGPGGAAAKIASLTTGRVVGVDLSAEMIKQAKSVHGYLPNVEFQIKNAVHLDFNNDFDTIFCNAAFQWFQEPDRVLQGCLQALKPGGTMFVQATATSRYCPVFLKAIETIAGHPETASVFSHWHSPFLFLDSAEAYRKLFSDHGYRVDICELRNESNPFTVEQVVDIFKSGAENGYLNQAYYDIKISDAYIAACRSIIKKVFQSLADSDGIIDLAFTRVYIKAVKPY